jgi:DNA polymerase-3 subunit beta
MKFIVNTTELLNHLQTVSGTIPNKAVLPILDNFLFDIRGGVLMITSTDLETSMTTAISVEADKDISVAIPSRLVLDTLRALPNQPVTFTIDEKSNAVEIKSEFGRYKLAGEVGAEFPRIPEMESVNQFDIPSEVLLSCVSKTIFATGNDDLRLNLTGVYVEMSKKQISFVSTDANRLVRCIRKDLKPGIDSNFILPKKALNLLKSTLPHDDSAVKISVNNTNAFFLFGDISLVCRLIDEKYPDYGAVIPDSNPNTLVVDRQDLFNSVRRISIFSNKTTNQIRMKLAGSEMTISAEDIDLSNEAVERLSCDYDGEDIEIGFNARYLTEMLANLNGKNVRFELSSPSRAGILLPDENETGEDLLMLIMPMMLNSNSV